ncbi:MAG: hypothetical protein ABSG59_21010 [Verrucomicrobiota bacterium]|jgi:hypothetical protein
MRIISWWVLAIGLVSAALRGVAAGEHWDGTELQHGYSWAAAFAAAGWTLALFSALRLFARLSQIHAALLRRDK